MPVCKCVCRPIYVCMQNVRMYVCMHVCAYVAILYVIMYVCMSLCMYLQLVSQPYNYAWLFDSARIHFAWRALDVLPDFFLPSCH